MAKAQTRKEALIKQCMLVFMRNGYYHTTFSDLAKACDVEKPHFYYYFKDKKDLMNEVLLFASERVQSVVFDVAYLEKKTPRERLHTMLNNVLKIHTSNDFGCLMGNTLLETVGRESHFKSTLCSYFDKWQESLTHLYLTSYDEPTAKEMARADLSKLQGGLMLMRLYNDKAIFEKTISEIKNRL